MKREEVEKLIGKENMKFFDKFIHGQTTGVTAEGKPDYYEWDVSSFKRHLDKVNALNYIFREMFYTVGKKYDLKLLKKKDWFTKYSWTQEQQETFRQWLETQLYKQKSLFYALSNSTRCTKPACKKLSGEFIFSYGWKIK
jgi:hypothetical protein